MTVLSSASPIHREQVFRYPPAILRLILCAAMALRIASIFVLRTYRHPNTWEFGEIAHGIMAGHGYTAVLSDGIRVPSAYMPPFYPYLLTTLWTTLGESSRSFLFLELLQALLGVLLVLFIYRLTALLFSSRVALMAAGIVAVWPAFIYLCNEFHSINIYILLGVAAVFHLVRYIEVSRSWQDAICLGLYMGVLLFCRAEAVSLIVLYALILLWRCGRASFLHATASCVIALTCLSPWVIRNGRVFGHLVMVTTSAGNNLWIGHNSHATGNYTWNSDYATPQQHQTLEHLMGHPDSEVLLDQQAKAFAIEFALSHPKQEATLLGRKIFLLFLYDPEHKKGSRIVYWGPSLLLLLLAFYGAWFHRDHLLKQDLPVTATVAFGFFISLAVFVLPRYRIAIDPFLVLFAANALMHWFSGELSPSVEPATSPAIL